MSPSIRRPKSQRASKTTSFTAALRLVARSACCQQAQLRTVSDPAENEYQMQTFLQLDGTVQVKGKEVDFGQDYEAARAALDRTNQAILEEAIPALGLIKQVGSSSGSETGPQERGQTIGTITAWQLLAADVQKELGSQSSDDSQMACEEPQCRDDQRMTGQGGCLLRQETSESEIAACVSQLGSDKVQLSGLESYCSTDSTLSGLGEGQQEGQGGSTGCTHASGDSGPVVPHGTSRFQQCYEVFEELGRGAFGRAVRAVRRADGAAVCIKMLQSDGMSRRERIMTRDEVRVLSQLCHPNIVAYHECFHEEGQQYIVMEYCEAGDLERFIKGRRGELLSEEEVMVKFVQICLALHHVHSKGILHRDIKSNNIFCTRQGILKLGDFGISKVMEANQSCARTMVGTPYYFSPELVQDKPYNGKSDVWALGCVLYELCTLRRPFKAQSISAIAVKILRGTYEPLPPQYSPQLRQLVALLLRRKADKRPTVEQVLGSSYVRQYMKRYKFLIQECVDRRRSSYAQALSIFKLDSQQAEHAEQQALPAEHSLDSVLPRSLQPQQVQRDTVAATLSAPRPPPKAVQSLTPHPAHPLQSLTPLPPPSDSHSHPQEPDPQVEGNLPCSAPEHVGNVPVAGLDSGCAVPPVPVGVLNTNAEGAAPLGTAGIAPLEEGGIAVGAGSTDWDSRLSQGVGETGEGEGNGEVVGNQTDRDHPARTSPPASRVSMFRVQHNQLFEGSGTWAWGELGRAAILGSGAAQFAVEGRRRGADTLQMQGNIPGVCEGMAGYSPWRGEAQGLNTGRAGEEGEYGCPGVEMRLDSRPGSADPGNLAPNPAPGWGAPGTAIPKIVVSPPRAKPAELSSWLTVPTKHTLGSPQSALEVSTASALETVLSATSAGMPSMPSSPGADTGNRSRSAASLTSTLLRQMPELLQQMQALMQEMPAVAESPKPGAQQAPGQQGKAQQGGLRDVLEEGWEEREEKERAARRAAVNDCFQELKARVHWLVEVHGGCG